MIFEVGSEVYIKRRFGNNHFNFRSNNEDGTKGKIIKYDMNDNTYCLLIKGYDEWFLESELYEEDLEMVYESSRNGNVRKTTPTTTRAKSTIKFNY
jgi:hypothetical protein